MLVHHILSNKAVALVTATPDMTITEAACLLAEKRIGAVVVTGKGGKLAGILSERDIVRALAVEGAACLARPVSALMTRKVVTCTPDDTISAVMEKMTEGRFRHMPVMDGDKLAGIVSIGDVVKFRLDEAQDEVRQLHAYVGATAA